MNLPPSHAMLVELNQNGFFIDSKIVEGFMESAETVAPTLTTTRAHLLRDKSKIYVLMSVHSTLEYKIPNTKKEWIVEKA